MHDIQDKMHDFTHKAVSVFSVEPSSVTEKDIKELQRYDTITCILYNRVS